MELLPLSIVTVNLNNLEGLRKTITSVLKQSWQDFEYVIIDGGSTDGSKEYIQSQNDKVDYWVSEPDNGIYHGMNKGIKASKGKYLLFLNSGDTLHDEHVLVNISNHLKENIGILYGAIHLGDTAYPENRDVLDFPEKLKFSFFWNSTITQQAAFIERSLFKKVFFYNENLKYVSDWEFFMCAICKYNSTYKKLNFVISDFDRNGISSDPNNEKFLYKEREHCLKIHFPAMWEDYKELNYLKSRIKIPSVKASLELEDYITARKINARIVNFLLKISKMKNGKN